MSERDQTMAARRGAQLGPVVEVDETTLSAHLTEGISKDIFHMVSSLALLDIPNHIHILLILIQVFTRDGQQMEKHVSLQMQIFLFSEKASSHLKAMQTK